MKSTSRCLLHGPGMGPPIEVSYDLISAGMLYCWRKRDGGLALCVIGRDWIG